MKKILSLFSVSALCLLVTLSAGCGGKDDPTTTESCEAKINAFQNALNAYIADPVKSKCDAVKAAATPLLSCPGLTPAQKSDYKASVDAIVCD